MHTELVFKGGPIQGIAYVPPVKEKVANLEKYNIPQGIYRYNPQRSHKDWSTSEARKQELFSQIGDIRKAIRSKAANMEQKTQKEFYQEKLLRENQIIGKLAEDILYTTYKRSTQKIGNILFQEAKKLGVSKKVISAQVDVILAAKGCVVCDLTDNIFN